MVFKSSMIKMRMVSRQCVIKNQMVFRRCTDIRIAVIPVIFHHLRPSRMENQGLEEYAVCERQAFGLYVLL